MRPIAQGPDDVSEDQAHLPEVVAIDELSPGALAAAAAEIAEQEEEATWPTATA